jgi:hypothetical protein
VSSVVENPVNPELYVIVSIAQRKKGGKPVIHAWGEGLVVDNGKPYTDRGTAERERRRAIRETTRRGERPEDTEWHVCKVLGTQASYVDELGIGRPS